MLWKWISKPSLERHKYSLPCQNKVAAARFSALPPPCFPMFRSILVSTWFFSTGMGFLFEWRFCDSFPKHLAFDSFTHVPFMFPSCSLHVPFAPISKNNFSIQRSFQGLRVPFGTFVLRPARRLSTATECSCNSPGHCNCCFYGHRTFRQRSRALQLLRLRPQNAPATLLDAATAASEATERSCNARGRCNCCF